MSSDGHFLSWWRGLYGPMTESDAVAISKLLVGIPWRQDRRLGPRPSAVDPTHPQQLDSDYISTIEPADEERYARRTWYRRRHSKL